MQIYQAVAAVKKLFISLVTVVVAVTCLNIQANDHSKHILSIENARVNPTVKGITVSAAYFTISNAGDNDIYLIKINSDLSNRAEIHEHTMSDGLMKMQEVKNGIAITANQTVSLKPGGYHVMLMNLDAAIKPGDQIKLILTFSNGKEKVIMATAKLTTTHHKHH